MRFSNYKLLNEMCDTFISALNIVKNTGDMSLKNECINFLYSISNNIEQNMDSLQSDSVIKCIESIISSFENNYEVDEIITLAEELSTLCKNEIKYKIRVLFVAELGGKWDSMASVYYAMKERDDVIVDVVLQPIFRAVKLEDGTERTDIIYKDYLTPMGIEHIPYTKYDMEKTAPDMTFISQPYESVTVPMFWPENIAKYSRLVYLPYYAAVTIDKEKSAAFSSFFLSDVQKYSWKIIAQSDIMKKHYKKYASRHGENVVVTGLPKWDYVTTINKYDVSCPEEWIPKITGKKVFLWNTHFNFSSSGSGSRILSEEGMNFLEIFLNNPNIALIWRPHPMTETVVKVYYPQLLPAFHKMKNIVEKSENMIIDNYESYVSSFVWSDALISDLSSIADQYILLDKPVLLIFKENDVYSMLEESYYESGLMDYSGLPYSVSIDDTKKFIEDVINQNDVGKLGRANILNEFFALADDCCGERVSEYLINELKNELNIKELESYKFLFIGDFDSSKPCIDMCIENNYSFAICDLFNNNVGVEYNTFVLNEINNYDFECVCITHKNAYNSIRRNLVENLGVKENKIIDFWKVYQATLPLMVCDRVMMNPNKQFYDGIILGLSHTEVGILSDRLHGEFGNLSVSSQDLFFQYKTLEYCINKYPEKLSKLKYAIIETHNYNYFNFDTSLGNAAFRYLAWGGYNKEPHNFESNNKLNISFDDAMTNVYKIKSNNSMISEIELWKKYFMNIFDYTDYSGFSPNYNIYQRTGIVTKEQINEYMYNRSVAMKIFPKTIEDNKENFKNIILLLKSINPDIKIYSIIIPRYIETERRDYNVQSKHIPYFNDIIEEAKNKYGIIHLDFKKISDISEIESYYYDAGHLNVFGAQVLTDMLNDIIYEN